MIQTVNVRNNIVVVLVVVFLIGLVWFMVFNATFNNISVILWLSVSLVKYPEKTADLPQVTDKLYQH
jgi:hypothetical protein